MIAIHKESGEPWNATRIHGDGFNALDGLSGPYSVPDNGVIVSMSRRSPRGFWSETHGMTAEEFDKDFTIAYPGNESLSTQWRA